MTYYVAVHPEAARLLKCESVDYPQLVCDNCGRIQPVYSHGNYWVQKQTLPGWLTKYIDPGWNAKPNDPITRHDMCPQCKKVANGSR